MFEKGLLVLVLIVVSALLATLGALLLSLFMYLGWNYGIVPATGMHTVTFWQSFWLSEFLAITGTLLKGSHAEVKYNA